MIKKLRIAHYLLNVVLILLALSVCVSEPLSRNIIRVIFALCAVKFFIGRNAAMELVKRYKVFLLTMSAFAWWMIISSVYGGHLVSDSDSRVYWFFFSHNMILFIPLTLMIRRQKISERLLIALAISLLIDDAFMAIQIFGGVAHPITFLNDSSLQSSILYVILLPTFLIITLNTDDLIKRFFFGVTFFISLTAFLYLYTQAAQVVLAIVFVIILAEEFRRHDKFFIVFMTAGIIVIMSRGVFNTIDNFTELYRTYQTFWEIPVSVVANNPIMGVGLGNYNASLSGIYLVQAKALNLHHALNTYLQFWAETGIVGLALFCGIFGSILMWARRRCGNLYGQILFFATLALMLYSLTDFIFDSYSAMRLYWVMLGICIASLDR